MALDREKLKILMKSRGVTQKKIKEATGKDARTVSRWLSGNNIPKDRDLRIIADLLQCEPVAFYKNFVDAPDEGVAIHSTVSVAAYNAYEVMGIRYGVTQRDIMEIAPVLFAIVAGHALRVPQQDIDAYWLAKRAGLNVQIGGNAEDSAGFDLDERAAEQRKCFGIAADPWEAAPRNLFAEAVKRLCEDLGGIVDPKDMYQPDAGAPLKAVGFNVAPQVIAKLADGDEERAKDFVTGRLRLPPREILKDLGKSALLEELQRQTKARQARREAERQESLSKLSGWQTAYAAEHPEMEAEYHDLASRYYEAVGYVKDGSSAEDRDALYSDPFSEKRDLKEGISTHYVDLFGEADETKKAQAEQVARLKKLEKHRRASKRAFGADTSQ